MKPRITVLTLGVDDLERAVYFYRDGLGFPTEGIVGTEFIHGAVAFLDLEGGLKLALFPRASIAHDAGIPAEPPNGPGRTEMTIGHNVASEAEVDATMARALEAGAVIVKPATSRIRTDTSGRSSGIPIGVYPDEIAPSLPYGVSGWQRRAVARCR